MVQQQQRRGSPLLIFLFLVPPLLILQQQFKLIPSDEQFSPDPPNYPKDLISKVTNAAATNANAARNSAIEPNTTVMVTPNNFTIAPTNSILSDRLYCFDQVKECKEWMSKDTPVPATKSNRSNLAGMDGTLALGAPVLMGGYRNQYMRFVGLVSKAIEKNQQLLLPSIKWFHRGTSQAVPFELLWDVDHWNDHARSNDSIRLPLLVDYDASLHGQWNPQTRVFYGSCSLVVEWFKSPHKTNVYKNVQDSNEPHAFGGSPLSQPNANLWDTYRKLDKGRRRILLPNRSNKIDTATTLSLEQLESWILSAMRPSPAVKSLVDDIVYQAARKNGTNNDASSGDANEKHRFLALHPRVEPEMLIHGHCLEEKMRNLTEILDMVNNHSDFANLDSMFLAIDVPQVLRSSRGNFKDHANHNMATLTRILQSGGKWPQPAGSDSSWKVWTAGEQALSERRSVAPLCMDALLSSVVNMEIALQAHVFVGTSLSTWSISVWKTRYRRGKPNYEFTRMHGIRKLDGPPEPFHC